LLLAELNDRILIFHAQARITLGIVLTIVNLLPSLALIDYTLPVEAYQQANQGNIKNNLSNRFQVR
jgi:hypothetical protein